MGWFFFQWDHSRGPSDHEARPDLAEREQHCDRMAALLPPIIIQKPSFFLFIYISSYHSGEGKESLFMKSDWVIWCSWCPAAPPNQSEGEGRSPRSSFWCRLTAVDHQRLQHRWRYWGKQLTRQCLMDRECLQTRGFSLYSPFGIPC